TVPANTVLTDAQIARLQAGGYYVNVHTALNPSGEIRGQLNPDSIIANKFDASLNLTQEVPTPTTPAGATMGGY
ncbi:MAG TPA: CHRD domain-containing protein, partial [Dongiaceae bacterium]|nr:CHRD domain-containing protein [Dongiaceae bacterium]